METSNRQFVLILVLNFVLIAGLVTAFEYTDLNVYGRAAIAGVSMGLFSLILRWGILKNNS
jgi:hypothetical protein